MKIPQMAIDYNKIEKFITSPSTNICLKMRYLFLLRNDITLQSAKIICKTFNDTSVLLKHEAAYVLGQMKIQNSEISNKLVEVLKNVDEDEIVRHECAEALGNYECSQVIPLLKEFADNDKSVAVRETSYLAYKKLESNINEKSPFGSHDPANAGLFSSIEEAGAVYLDMDECLYKRYAAMFYLRNLNTKEAVDILGKGFTDKSALFKHEVAFVFGQMKNIHSVKYLSEALHRLEEHGMVRHECAEALGAIGGDDAKKALEKHIHCTVDIVRESVEVALDLHDYGTSQDLEYCVA
ncbi:Deoxyhypusine hydroxylase/monooxygenase [Spraguea lophii 42_110]|uniref:Deoxyhypusine hydroxylase n=1 Tax=Spraguea lophii (strain 42_110) TaxID=1358809 RepID=S7W607_SPRLO|nr:Deoxyhypusine hydroxylase/monooxygenase [Spraguea lophii 42_110]